MTAPDRDLHRELADLELRAVTAEGRADWWRRRLCVALGVPEGGHGGDADLLDRLDALTAQHQP